MGITFEDYLKTNITEFTNKLKSAGMTSVADNIYTITRWLIEVDVDIAGVSFVAKDNEINECNDAEKALDALYNIVEVLTVYVNGCDCTSELLIISSLKSYLFSTIEKLTRALKAITEADVLEFIHRRFKKDNDWATGNCYYFACILKERFCDNEAEIYYDCVDGHFVCKIDGCFYDYNGKVVYESSEYVDKYLKRWDTFHKEDDIWFARIVRDVIL